MCGLLGAFGKHLDLSSVALERALQCLKHRGPDDEGVARPSSEMILGHRRLSIQDLSMAGHQPMEIDNKWIVFNGEIYNHLALRQEWLSDEKFSSMSDTETLLRLLNRYGLTILPHLKGMFAAAWYNLDENKVHLFRDSLGIKPLFYFEIGESSSVFFASEIKCFFEMADIPRVLDREVLMQYLTFENYSVEKTLFRGIHSLKKGEIRSYSIEKNALQCISIFFSAVSSDLQSSEEDCIDTLEKKIIQSVQSHLVSDVSIGVYLSGGIDSSLVATLAAQANSNLIGFTGYFEDEDEHYDERKLARLVAEKSKFPLCEIKITSDHFVQNFDLMIYHLDQPRMGMGAFSQFIVAAEAAKHRKVILAGHGGDELFAGYPLHKAAYLLSQVAFGLGSWSILRKMKSKEWPWYLYSVSKRILTGRFFFAPQIWKKSSVLSAQDFSSSSEDLLDVLDHYYQDTYIPGLLEVEDRISMAHGLETRVPLWSQDLVSFSQKIPIEKKLQNGVLKYLLKMVAKKWLPAELLSAPKRGFPTPLRKWFRNELFDFVSERLLNSPHSSFYMIFSKQELHEILESHRDNYLPFALDELRAHKIWTALCVESWLRQFRMEVN